MSDEAQPPDVVSAPIRQADGLEITEVVDGLVIYQADPEQVHYLNGTAALIFEFCTGANSAEDIARLLADTFALAEPPLEIVVTCLAELWSLGLIDSPPELTRPGEPTSHDRQAQPV